MNGITWKELVPNNSYWVYGDGFTAPYVAKYENGLLWLPAHSEGVTPKSMCECAFVLVKLPPFVAAKDNALYIRTNFRCSFPKFAEGYWRDSEVQDHEALAWRTAADRAEAKLPYPVVLSIALYDKEEFVAQLEELQAHAQLENFRSFYVSRLTGETLPNGEYSLNEWTWHSSLIHYLKAGVPPSRAFYKFVTDRDLETLPKYGRA